MSVLGDLLVAFFALMVTVYAIVVGLAVLIAACLYVLVKIISEWHRREDL